MGDIGRVEKERILIPENEPGTIPEPMPAPEPVREPEKVPA
jgi:hypothetical protein